MTPTIPTSLDRTQLEALYESTEQEYFKSLPLEHFMESVPHATQRKITLESFDVIHTYRPDIQCFNELLIQYPLPGRPLDKPGQVVPDNTVVIWSEPIEAKGSFSTALQRLIPNLVLEYVSKSSQQKDYEDNFEKYEKELKVPYYLLFDPEAIELTLYRLASGRYQEVPTNANGRRAIAEMELEVAVHEGWVRYWFREELVALTAELQIELVTTKAERDAARTERDAANAARDAANAARDAANAARDAANAERDAANAAQDAANTARDAASAARDAAMAKEKETTAALSAKNKAFEAERRAREAAEAELAKLREELARVRQQP